MKAEIQSIKSVVTITRKIQITPNTKIQSEKDEYYSKLRYLSDECCKMANFIVNQQHINHSMQERIVLSDENLKNQQFLLDSQLSDLNYQFKLTRDKILKEKIKSQKIQVYEQQRELKNIIQQKFDNFLGCSIQNTTYRLLKEKFPNISSNIRTSINQNVYKNYKEDIKGLLRNEKTVRTYKSFPLTFQYQSVRNLKFDNELKEYTFDAFQIPFKTHLGRDRSNNNIFLQKIINGEYKLCGSSISTFKNKWFFNAVVQFSANTDFKPSADISVGVDIGVVNPIFLTSTNDTWGFSIGNINQLFHKKKSFFNQRKSLQQSISESKGGKGYLKKMKKLVDLQKVEKNYTQTLLHTYAKQVIDYAIKQNAGIIKLEFFDGLTENEQKQKYLIRFWPVRRLQCLIEEKASKFENLKVLYVDPYMTSQTCSTCNYYEEGQRKLSTPKDRNIFVCKNPICKQAGKKQNSDRNASINICNSQKYISSKQDCHIYKFKKEKIQLTN